MPLHPTVSDARLPSSSCRHQHKSSPASPAMTARCPSVLAPDAHSPRLVLACADPPSVLQVAAPAAPTQVSSRTAAPAQGSSSRPLSAGMQPAQAGSSSSQSHQDSAAGVGSGHTSPPGSAHSSSSPTTQVGPVWPPHADSCIQQDCQMSSFCSSSFCSSRWLSQSAIRISGTGRQMSPVACCCQLDTGNITGKCKKRPADVLG